MIKPNPGHLANRHLTNGHLANGHLANGHLASICQHSEHYIMFVCFHLTYSCVNK